MTYASGLTFGAGDEYELRPAYDLVYNVDDPQEAKIVNWRGETLERLGFTPLVALALATRRDICVHRVTGMIRDGATPTQVADIVL